MDQINHVKYGWMDDTYLITDSPSMSCDNFRFIGLSYIRNEIAPHWTIALTRFQPKVPTSQHTTYGPLTP